MNRPDGTTRTRLLRTVLRRLVLGAFLGTTAVTVLLVGEAVLSATGLCPDPHGYGMIFGLLIVAILTPVTLALWLLYQSLRRPRN